MWFLLQGTGLGFAAGWESEAFSNPDSRSVVRTLCSQSHDGVPPCQDLVTGSAVQLSFSKQGCLSDTTLLYRTLLLVPMPESRVCSANTIPLRPLASSPRQLALQQVQDSGRVRGV